jgi:hypothetical protein
MDPDIRAAKIHPGKREPRPRRSILRCLPLSAALGLSAAVLLSAPASAQTESFAGRYAFHSLDVKSGAPVRTLSGFADSRRLSDGTYQISMLVIQYDQTNGDQTQGLALQSCVGRPSDRDLVITCRVEDTSFDSYSPDNFVISADGSSGLWSGQISSSGDTEVLFFSIAAAFGSSPE